MPTTHRSQELARIALGAFMVYAGVSHLSFKRQEFQAQVPDWFPGDKDPVVIGSGVAEVLAGSAMLALPRHRMLTGGALAGFYAAVFPGNIAQYVEHKDAFGLDTDRKRLIRLFFQPALIAAALYGGGVGASGKGSTKS